MTTVKSPNHGATNRRRAIKSLLALSSPSIISGCRCATGPAGPLASRHGPDTAGAPCQPRGRPSATTVSGPSTASARCIAGGPCPSASSASRGDGGLALYAGGPRPGTCACLQTNRSIVYFTGSTYQSLYVTVRHLSAYLPVCLILSSINRYSNVRRVYCCGPRRQAISIYCCSRRRRTAARQSAANASSVTLSDDVGR